MKLTQTIVAIVAALALAMTAIAKPPPTAPVKGAAPKGTKVVAPKKPPVPKKNVKKATPTKATKKTAPKFGGVKPGPKAAKPASTAK